MVDSIERAIIRTKPNFSKEDFRKIIENHKPKIDFSGLPIREGMTIVSPAKKFHLIQDDFLPWIKPFGLDPFPASGIDVVTDIIGRVYYISISCADKESGAENIESFDEDSDLPF